MDSIKMPKLKKYLESLFLFTWLTIILAGFALNRLSVLMLNGHLFIDFPLRVYLEHFLTGFWIVSASLFFMYSGKLIYSLLMREKFTFLSKSWEILSVIITVIIYVVFEIYYQFFVRYNSDSWLQMLLSIFGIIAGFWLMRKQKRL